MAWTLGDFERATREEIGPELGELVTAPVIYRWTNEGIDRIGFWDVKEAALAWVEGDRLVSLPADFRSFEDLEAASGERLPPYRILNRKLRILRPGGAERDQTATLIYFSSWPLLTGSDSSPLPELGDQAVVSYNLYRYYKRLASTRADYRKYATITGSNGVDIEELDALSERHLNDFEEARQSLVSSEPAFFYSGG